MKQLAGIIVFASLACFSWGCQWGTLSDDELLAEYQVEPEEDPVEMVQGMFEELADELDGEIQVFEMDVYPSYGTVSALDSGQKGRLYEYSYDGFWMNERGIDSANAENLEERLFTLEDIPLDALPGIIEAGRARVDFEPASFRGLSIARDDAPPWGLRLQVSYGTLGDAAWVVFDGEGNLVE